MMKIINVKNESCFENPQGRETLLGLYRLTPQKLDGAAVRQVTFLFHLI